LISADGLFVYRFPVVKSDGRFIANMERMGESGTGVRANIHIEVKK
jgi:hypothetical protein